MQNKPINLLDIAGVLSYIILVNGDKCLNKKDDPVIVDYKKQFLEIEQWLTKKNFTVNLETDAEDSIVWADRVVNINSRNHPETKYYTLLHECGHLLIAQSAKQWEKDVPMYACFEDARIEKSKAYRVSLVAEEIEAWKRGRRLAMRFGHHIDDVKYDKQITENVFTYIEAAATGAV